MKKTCSLAMPVPGKKRHLLLFFILAILFACSAAAQESHPVKISGTVKDSTGAGIPGVTVREKKTSNTVLTDSSGHFTLSVKDASAVLEFSSVSYTATEVALNNRTSLDVTLQALTGKLDDVVVIGYGSVKKSDLTGSVATVKSTDLQERPASSLNQNLSGRATGVNVSSNSGRPGGRANIRIRGTTSISISNNPLFVIDGVILNTADLQNGSTPIDYINPNDIASIEVLKDASSTAIYGARGANGVILVTTKRGTASGGKVSYDVDISLSKVPREIGVLNSEEFLKVEEIAYANAQKYDPIGWASGTKYVDPKTKRTNPKLFDSQGKPLYNTNWQDLMFRNAFTQNHQLAFTNGNEKGSYGVFLNYRDEAGVVRGSAQRRYAGRFVFDSQIKDWLKVGGTLSYTDQNDKQIDDLGNGGIVVMRQVLEALPIIPVKYANGAWASNRDYPGMEGGDNPLRLIEDRLYYLRTQTLLGNVYGNIHLAKGLDFKSIIGVNVINQRKDYYADRDLKYISDVGDASITNDRFNSWQFENYLTYNKKFRDIHAVTAMAGVSWQRVDRFQNIANAQNFTDNFYRFYNLGAGANPQASSSFGQAYSLQSYFARLNYGLKNKYLFTFTGRMDGSSKFGTANRYSFFPSAAFAWRASDEDFLKNSRVISNLKFRTSYGNIGNSEIPAYRYFAGMSNYPVIFGNDRVIGVGINRMNNDNLRWEKTEQFDAGVELGLFNRINLEVDVYRKKTVNMLLDAPVPSSSGYSSVTQNVGSMENKGIEFSVSSTNISTKNFTWTTLFNLSINKNKVLALAGGSDIFVGNTVVRVAQPVGSFYGYVSLGTWGSNEAAQAQKYGLKPGDIKYLDLNNDGKINDNDRTIIGKGIPDGFGTFSNTFRYKNWSLLVDLQFMYGNDVLNRSIHSLEDRQGIANSYKTVLDAWTETNQNTSIAQIRPIAAYYTTNNDTHKITDASFIRGRNLMLSYSFPRTITSRMKLDRLRTFVSIQNFFVMTKYKGYDPEVSNSGAAFDQGVALYDYPRPRIFMFGLNVGL